MEIQIGQRYRHYKGNAYVIIAIAHHSETLEKLIVYQNEHDDPDFGKNPVWVRPYEMFMETVVLDGKTIQRFQPL